MRRLLKTLWAYIILHKGLFILGAITGVVFTFSFTYFLKPYFDNQPQTELIGLTGNYTIQTLPIALQEKLSQGLTKGNIDGTVEPWAATIWEATDSAKKYVFKLQPSLVWHDGTPFTANDVNYKLQDVKIVALDKNNVEFNLAGSFSPLPSVVSQPLFKSGLIGLGEYRLKSLKTSGRFLQELVIESSHKKLVYKFYPTSKAVITALRLGEIDVAENVTDLGEAENLKIVSKLDYTRQAVILFNTKISPLEDKSFRQALNYSLPETNYPGQASFGPITPVSWAYNPSLKKYPHDLEIARNLLKKNSASQSGQLTLTAISDLVPLAFLIADSWKKLGFDVQVETSEVAAESFQAYLTFIEIPKDPDQYLLWHSISPQNKSGYKSPRSDKLLEEGRQVVDSKVRKEKYLEFQRAITEDVPAAFLYFPNVYTVTRK